MRLVALNNKFILNTENISEYLQGANVSGLDTINPAISFDNEGDPLSYWNDKIWCFNWNKHGVKNLDFILNLDIYSNLNKTYFREFKYVILCIYYNNYRNYKNSSFIKILGQHLNIFFRISQSLSYNSICELTEELKFVKILEKIKGLYSYGMLLSQLTTFRLANQILNPKFPLHIQFANNTKNNKSGLILKDLAIKYSRNKSESLEQTLYIPNNIHSKLISCCIEVIQNKQKKLDDIMNFLEEDYLLYESIKKDLNIIDVSSSKSKRKIRTIKLNKTQKLMEKYTLLEFCSLNEIQKEFNIVIDREDVKESELLNGVRSNIQVGKFWPLASHQFRRTLIVNFVSHRLSNINAVKQQVKHMYATMTEYYAKNSNLAETFKLNVVQEISNIIEDELLKEGVRQYKEFYYSDEQLEGIKGKEIMSQRETVKFLSDSEIKQLFKTGLYRISKSMYGYCTKGNLCDKKEAIDPTFCGASCSTMVITKSNAENWQKLYLKNKKLLISSNELIIGGIPMSAAKTTMQGQNEVAKTIMDKFNIKYEE